MTGNSLYTSILVLTALLSCPQAHAQRNEIYVDKIASLQVVAGQDWLSPPITTLNGQPINISFDDLTHEYHRYVYRIEHCEADWTVSDELFPSDFCDGFTEGIAIEDIEESINTNTLYTHYRLQIPNRQCRLRMSGNYRLTVYDENNSNQEVLSASFMVAEPVMGVSMDVTTNTDLDINGRHQQVNMQLLYGPQRVINPTQQIKTVILQNGRWDRAVVNPTPQYVMHDGLQWLHNKDLIFDGGNEYRKFETLDVSHTTLGLESINWDGTDYHAYVWTDEPRYSYTYDEDANGAFYIRNSDNIENDVASEYLWVHFALRTPPLAEPVYLNAVWTNDQFLPQYQLTYNAQTQCYEAEVFLKQGYYSYQYLTMHRDGTCSPVPTEGNFYQTENQYQALVYFRGTNERTDRLVGYQQIRK